MIKAIVTDIEGTTSSIDFVHRTLFPYAKAHLRAFLHTHAGDAAVRRLLAEVERIENRTLSVDAAADVLERWIDEDRKLTPLKALQGMIWRTGYESGALKGHVYPDTPEYLRRWQAQGKRLYVYSSGSVEAQKLIFAHTDYGDLTPLFSGYFDTQIGGKREVDSYRRILEHLALPGADVLFLSDVGEELDAARAAGMQTCQLLRDDKAVPARAHPQARSFADIVV
ncbi:acireductone synthase [Fontimonas thermophila]|uniref:Enolase-phosphatase E1 n=1 Tax=Fontimonas thermophila TaxID=1076937 RepID=A0A1I2K7B0_9GAMM|nr:acireductone synthase [Fontimonas thermophila]SFF63022.1 acireductone synthase [Fontimonas thermophila]